MKYIDELERDLGGATVYFRARDPSPVKIPDLTTDEVVKVLGDRLRSKGVQLRSWRIAGRDIISGKEHGNTYEALLWRPVYATVADVCERWRAGNAAGNMSAFLVWVTMHYPMGGCATSDVTYATILPEAVRFPPDPTPYDELQYRWCNVDHYWGHGAYDYAELSFRSYGQAYYTKDQFRESRHVYKDVTYIGFRAPT